MFLKLNKAFISFIFIDDCSVLIIGLEFIVGNLLPKRSVLKKTFELRSKYCLILSSQRVSYAVIIVWQINVILPIIDVFLIIYIFFLSDVWPSMVTQVHTPRAVGRQCCVPGEQLGVWCLAQGSHLSRGIEGGENARSRFKVQGSLLFVTYTIIQGIIGSEMLE